MFCWVGRTQCCFFILISIAYLFQIDSHSCRIIKKKFAKNKNQTFYVFLHEKSYLLWIIFTLWRYYCSLNWIDVQFLFLNAGLKWNRMKIVFEYFFFVFVKSLIIRENNIFYVLHAKMSKDIKRIKCLKRWMVHYE